MEREVSSILGISVTLIAIAALLGIVIFTVTVGEEIKAGTGEAITDMRDNISVDYVRDLSRGEIETEMPTATAYNILTMYRAVILESASGFDGTVSNLQSEGSELGDRLTGRVHLEVIPVHTKNDLASQFVAFIHEEDCKWYLGVDTCTTKTGFEDLKTKYNLNLSWSY